MNLALIDHVETDEEEAVAKPWRTLVGRRQAPQRETVREIEAPEPEPITALDRAVMCNAYGGIWLTLRDGNLRELAGLHMVGIVSINFKAKCYQLTVKGAREMGPLPAEEGK